MQTSLYLKLPELLVYEASNLPEVLVRRAHTRMPATNHSLFRCCADDG